MNKDYTNEQIKVAVDKYFEVKSSRTAIEVLGYPTATSLLRWAKLDPRWTRRRIHYHHSAYETRCACVSAYLDEGESCRSIAKRHGVSASQISSGAKMYLRSGPSALKPVQRKGMPISRRNDKARPNPTPDPHEIKDEDLRSYSEQLKFENDVLRAELELFAKKACASAKKNS